MKKLTLIAIAVAAASGSANAAKVYEDEKHAVDLYGRIYAGYTAGDDAGKSDNFGADQYVRFGAKVKSMIGASNYALGRYELQMENNGEGDNTSATKARLAYAGFGGDFGEVTFGRNYGALELVADWTDSSYVNPYGNSAIGISSSREEGIGRSDSVLKYAGEFSGFDIHASYKFNDNQKMEDADGNQTVDADNSAYGIALAYTFDFGLGLGAGYNIANNGEAKDSKLALLGVNYDANGVYAAANYSMGENNKAFKLHGSDAKNEHTGYELVAGYKFTKTFRAQAMWNKAEVEPQGGAKYDNVDYYTIEGRYDLTKQLRIVAAYQINNIDNAENEFHFAARYDF
ncbi:porin [Agarivorans sp. Toyoura001]|uniref:porin n=1 Tax=unclassified Agarivorans TaxID=2636026 RepID=UPI0010CEC972|nr:porin [Agarivorans sp. Toyoura001]GDY25217.1 porin [Agarivorans sp. Toyoura001]